MFLSPQVGFIFFLMAINTIDRGFQANYTVVRRYAETTGLLSGQRHCGVNFFCIKKPLPNLSRGFCMEKPELETGILKE